jgi:capsular polysaccharide biosynthesis protein
MFKNEIEIDVFRCINALFKKKKIIACITALFLVIGVALTVNPGEDKYTASSTVYAAADGSYADASNAVTAMNAYLDVAKSYKVSQRAALIIGRSDVSATDVQEATNVNSSATTSKTSSTISSFMNSSATIITFTATSTEPALAMEMADAMAQSYAIEMNSIFNSDSVKTLDNAYTYVKSTNATIEAWKDRIKVTAVGFVLACLLVVICEIFDRKVRTIREASIRESIPVIGIIPDYKE